MFQVIKQDIFKFFFLYIERGSIFAMFAFFLTLIAGSFLIRKHVKEYGDYFIVLIKSVEMAFLSLYVYIVIGITFLSREKHSDTYINLRPFSTFDRTLVYPKYIYENILMLIPLAILLYLLAAPFRKLSISLLVGFFSSLAIEIMQLITRLGLFIVDDILTNILGMLIGYLICRMAEWLYKSCYIILKGKEKT
jgi:glycopeptide antibiotics resistance protein